MQDEIHINCFLIMFIIAFRISVFFETRREERIFSARRKNGSCRWKSRPHDFKIFADEPSKIGPGSLIYTVYCRSISLF